MFKGILLTLIETYSRGCRETKQVIMNSNNGFNFDPYCATYDINSFRKILSLALIQPTTKLRIVVGKTWRVVLGASFSGYAASLVRFDWGTYCPGYGLSRSPQMVFVFTKFPCTPLFHVCSVDFFFFDCHAAWVAPAEWLPILPWRKASVHTGVLGFGQDWASSH